MAGVVEEEEASAAEMGVALAAVAAVPEEAAPAAVGKHAMKTREFISRLEQEYMGRGPKYIHAHLIGDLLVVRLQGVLTAAEQQLVKSLPAEKGRDLIKQVCTHRLETGWPLMEAMVQKLTAIEVLRLNPYISTVTKNEVVFVAVI